MRIKSSFVDYYDGVQGYGTDDILYVRETKLVKDKDLRWTNIYLVQDEKIPAYIIEFCNRTYKCAEWRGEYYYDYHKLKSAMFAIGINIEKEKYYSFYKHNLRSFFPRIEAPVLVKPEPRIKSKRSKIRGNRRNNFTKTKYIGLCEQYNSPIVVLGAYNEIHIDVRLNQYQFAKVRDPFSAYQELYQYFSNKANPEKPIPNNLDDKSMAEIKGFDKWSFRKEPTRK